MSRPCAALVFTTVQSHADSLTWARLRALDRTSAAPCALVLVCIGCAQKHHSALDGIDPCVLRKRARKN